MNREEQIEPDTKPKTSQEKVEPRADPGVATMPGMREMQEGLGNAQMQRMFGRDGSGGAMTLADLLSRLREEMAPAPPPEWLVGAARRASNDEALAVYQNTPDRELIRDSYNQDDALAILRVLLKKPYQPGDLSESYHMLNATTKSEVDDEANRELEHETGLSGALDFGNPDDRPFARRWLQIRDRIMERKNAKEVADVIKDGLLDKATAATLGDLRFELQALDGATKRELVSDEPFMTSLRDALDWDDFARCVEDLGRRAPSGKQLLTSSTVSTAIEEAWTRSNPHLPLSESRDDIDSGNHEEGGWIYMNLLTGSLVVEEAKASERLHFDPDGTVWIDLQLPEEKDDCVLIANFHVHPNKEHFFAGPSESDWNSISSAGVPGLLKHHERTQWYGPEVRASLAGSKTYPGM